MKSVHKPYRVITAVHIAYLIIDAGVTVFDESLFGFVESV